MNRSTSQQASQPGNQLKIKTRVDIFLQTPTTNQNIAVWSTVVPRTHPQVKQVDKDGSGEIGFQEFLSILQPRTSNASRAAAEAEAARGGVPVPPKALSAVNKIVTLQEVKKVDTVCMDIIYTPGRALLLSTPEYPVCFYFSVKCFAGALLYFGQCGLMTQRCNGVGGHRLPHRNRRTTKTWTSAVEKLKLLKKYCTTYRVYRLLNRFFCVIPFFLLFLFFFFPWIYKRRMAATWRRWWLSRGGRSS